jgi:hypothetical protein
MPQVIHSLSLTYFCCQQEIITVPALGELTYVECLEQCMGSSKHYTLECSCHLLRIAFHQEVLSRNQVHVPMSLDEPRVRTECGRIFGDVSMTSDSLVTLWE